MVERTLYCKGNARRVQFALQDDTLMHPFLTFDRTRVMRP